MPAPSLKVVNTSKEVQVLQVMQVQVQEHMYTHVYTWIHVQVQVHVQEITVCSVSQASNVRPLIESGLCAQCVSTVQCVGKLPTRVATVFLDPDT